MNNYKDTPRRVWLIGFIVGATAVLVIAFMVFIAQPSKAADFSVANWSLSPDQCNDPATASLHPRWYAPGGFCVVSAHSTVATPTGPTGPRTPRHR